MSKKLVSVQNISGQRILAGSGKNTIEIAVGQVCEVSAEVAERLFAMKMVSEPTKTNTVDHSKDLEEANIIIKALEEELAVKDELIKELEASSKKQK